MAKIERFEDIEAWQRARVLVRNVYVITRQGSFSRIERKIPDKRE